MIKELKRQRLKKVGIKEKKKKKTFKRKKERKKKKIDKK